MRPMFTWRKLKALWLMWFGLPVFLILVGIARWALDVKEWFDAR